MTSKAGERFVFDTNILVSAYLFPDSGPGHALNIVLLHHRLLMSLESATELAEVMRREKFDCFLSLKRREEAILTIRDFLTRFETTRIGLFLIPGPYLQLMAPARY